MEPLVVIALCVSLWMVVYVMSRPVRCSRDDNRLLAALLVVPLLTVVAMLVGIAYLS